MSTDKQVPLTPLTMSGQHELDLRKANRGDSIAILQYLRPALRELDAERAAHAKTQERLEGWKFQVETSHEVASMHIEENNKLKEQLVQAQAELDRNTRMRTTSRIYCHVAPDQEAIKKNSEIEPDGERLRRELTDWLERNGIVSMLLDTPNHAVTVDIAKLPPRIKPILRLWGSIYAIDAALRAKQEPPQALPPAEVAASQDDSYSGEGR